VVKTRIEFPKLWHVGAIKRLVVLGIALYDAVRAMQFSHEGELQLAIIIYCGAWPCWCCTSAAS
jgi:hypothetical protein